MLDNATGPWIDGSGWRRGNTLTTMHTRCEPKGSGRVSCVVVIGRGEVEVDVSAELSLAWYGVGRGESGFFLWCFGFWPFGACQQLPEASPVGRSFPSGHFLHLERNQAGTHRAASPHRQQPARPLHQGSSVFGPTPSLPLGLNTTTNQPERNLHLSPSPPATLFSLALLTTPDSRATGATSPDATTRGPPSVRLQALPNSSHRRHPLFFISTPSPLLLFKPPGGSLSDGRPSYTTLNATQPTPLRGWAQSGAHARCRRLTFTPSVQSMGTATQHQHQHQHAGALSRYGRPVSAPRPWATLDRLAASSRGLTQTGPPDPAEASGLRTRWISMARTGRGGLG